MFEPETEDMLPRMAPKPIAVVSLEATDRIVRPQVPEVSILFGQQDVNVMQQHLLPITNDTKPTYEAWKKQMLPKVTFPPTVANGTEVHLKENTNVVDYNASRINLYPFRSAASGALTMTRAVHSGDSGVTMASNTLMYRRSLESCSEQMDYPQIPSQQSLPQTFPPSLNARDVLTICAGTQTDKISDTPNFCNEQWANVATKKDVDDVRKMLEEMNQEQQRIVKILEVLALNSSKQILLKPHTCDVAVQIEGIGTDNQYSVPEDKGDLQENSKNKFVQHLKLPNKNLQSHKGKPIAQSTTYGPNSPQPQRLQEKGREVSPLPNNQKAGCKPDAIVSRSASDSSLFMNELALKYLPNEKLAELLKELNMECPLETASTIPSNIPTTIVKFNENKFEKGPSDISNASYKYLKKYRLLSDHEENDNKNNLENENHMTSYNLPQYNVRNTSANQRQTPLNKNSPYMGRLPLSPLARASPTPTAVPTHIVNLENIKQQPKFL